MQSKSSAWENELASSHPDTAEFVGGLRVLAANRAMLGVARIHRRLGDVNKNCVYLYKEPMKPNTI
jgi:hypothetical protein